MKPTPSNAALSRQPHYYSKISSLRRIKGTFFPASPRLAPTAGNSTTVSSICYWNIEFLGLDRTGGRWVRFFVAGAAASVACCELGASQRAGQLCLTGKLLDRGPRSQLNGSGWAGATAETLRHCRCVARQLAAPTARSGRSGSLPRPRTARCPPHPSVAAADR